MLEQPFLLPCGVTIPNRVVKSATTERLSNADGKPNDLHFQLYDRWADTRAGVLITGNIMIDPKHMESAGNVILQEGAIPEFQRWAEAGKKHGHHIWVQISHSGRQTSRLVNLHPKSASDVQLKKMGLFGRPRPMTEEDIEKTTEGFVAAARLCQRAGFTGVQIHAAHGYLISQFLSPLTNRRTDQWGGSIENRARLLLDIVRATRLAVGPDYPISVKLNSADFQRGGFTETESLQVIQMLAAEGIDLLEISGGTYERLAFFERYGADGELARESTRQREAFFIDFAQRVRQIADLPLMVTGGMRSYDFCRQILENGELDLIGMARPFIVDDRSIPAFIQGAVPQLKEIILPRGPRALQDSAEGGYYARQIIRLAKGQPLSDNTSVLFNATYLIWHELKKAIAKKKK